MTFTDELWFLVRIVIALVLGFAIGIERKMRYKEAGIRTHAIVSAGACLIMIVSKYGFTDSGDSDGTRIAAQIVSGIGFIGAGIILYKKEVLHGLTTAAGIWMTAGVGMAAGAGLYIVAVGSAAIIIGLQCVLHMKIRLFTSKYHYIFRIKFTCYTDENKKIKEIFKVDRYSKVSYFNGDDGSQTVSADIKTDNFYDDDKIKTVMTENKFIKSIERIDD
ncbi:MAG: MgtC/SapB family protein [Clostridiales bacterium]|jgi:putative Mg2+ transporter-C (MgtC) family protein|nr:MgtC/SapB family protein [Clostridiales bacterium]